MADATLPPGRTLPCSTTPPPRAWKFVGGHGFEFFATFAPLEDLPQERMRQTVPVTTETSVTEGDAVIAAATARRRERTACQ